MWNRGPRGGDGRDFFWIAGDYLLSTLKIGIYIEFQSDYEMIDKEKLAQTAEEIKNYFSPIELDEYEAETGVFSEDFREIYPIDFEGNIFAIDGSNVVVFDLGNVVLNHIRAGYVVYHGTEWQKTVITYDDLFTANEENYSQQFDIDLKEIFNLDGPFKISKKEEELDRISTFFRDLQEYVALYKAVKDAKSKDIILYDGSFVLWRDPYYVEVLKQIFEEAKRKNVDILGISKSSKLHLSSRISKPLVRSTDYIGSSLITDKPWYVELSGKKPIRRESWPGRTYVSKFHQRSTHAFRIDAPEHVIDHIELALRYVSAYSRSAESLGYPHALFRAHQDIMIPIHENKFIKLSLFETLRSKGLTEQQIRCALNYHEILDVLRRK